jgi:hypothetical protein
VIRSLCSRAAFAALFLAAAIGVPAWAAHRPAAAAAPNAVAAAMGPVVQPPAQRLAQALTQIGLTACAAPVMQAGSFLFENGEANFTIQPLGPDANRWPTVVMIEGAHATMGKTRLSTLTIAPGAGCSGFYQQVIYWPQACPELKRTVFAPFTSTRVLLRNVQISELNAGVQLYLMPAGTGCVSVKKELFH